MAVKRFRSLLGNCAETTNLKHHYYLSPRPPASPPHQDFYLMISIFTLQLCHLLFYFVRCVLLMKKKVKTVRDSKFYPRWVKHLCRKPDVPASAAHLTPCSQAAYKKTKKQNKTWGSAGSCLLMFGCGQKIRFYDFMSHRGWIFKIVWNAEEEWPFSFLRNL